MMKCLSQVNNGNWCQETYETASRDAGRRAKQLRADPRGFIVRVGSMGPQVTSVGTVKLTMVDIRPLFEGGDTYNLPAVEMVNWSR